MQYFKKDDIITKYCSNKYNVCFTSPQNPNICNILFQIQQYLSTMEDNPSALIESPSETVPINILASVSI